MVVAVVEWRRTKDQGGYAASREQRMEDVSRVVVVKRGSALRAADG